MAKFQSEIGRKDLIRRDRGGRDAMLEWNGGKISEIGEKAQCGAR